MQARFGIYRREHRSSPPHIATGPLFGPLTCRGEGGDVFVRAGAAPQWLPALPWAVVLQLFDQSLGVDLGERGVPPEAMAVLDASFAVRRSPALATALGHSWLT